MTKEIKWLTVLDVEEQTKIPNATIRRYIRNHGHHFNIRKDGKNYFLSSESIPIIQEIRKHYDGGKSLKQVEETLVKKGSPLIITVVENDEQMTVSASEVLQDIKKTLYEQNQIIQSLVEQVEKQQLYIDTRLEERDQRLLIALRESQEIKQIAASTEKKKNWFTRLFN